jgi:hypothetical protein
VIRSGGESRLSRQPTLFTFLMVCICLENTSPTAKTDNNTTCVMKCQLDEEFEIRMSWTSLTSWNGVQAEMLQKSENQWRSSKCRTIDIMVTIGITLLKLFRRLGASDPIWTAHWWLDYYCDLIICSGRIESTHTGEWIIILSPLVLRINDGFRLDHIIQTSYQPIYYTAEVQKTLTHPISLLLTHIFHYLLLMIFLCVNMCTRRRWPNVNCCSICV